MLTKANNLLQDTFIKNNAVFFVGSMLVAVLNYLYHPVLGRMMSVEDFGEAQTLISLFVQMSVFVGIFSVITVNIAANYDDAEERNAIIASLRKIALYIVGILFFVLVVFSTSLRDFFQFSSSYPFISLALLLLLGVSFTFRRAFLQGISDFQSVSMAGVILAAGKLAFAVALVSIGWRSFGAISGLLIAQGLALVYVYSKTKADLNLKNLAKDGVSRVIRQEYKYALLIFLSTFAIAFLYAADVLVVKHWFSPEEAGLYSGISTVAKIIFFAASSVSGVLLSAIKIKNTREANRNILNKGLFLILMIAGAGLVTFTLFSNFIVDMLIGSRYLVLASLLPELSLLMALASLINVLFFYFLALRSPIIVAASLMGPISILLLSSLNHDSLQQIIYNFLIGSVIVLAVLFFGIYQKDKFKEQL